MSMPSDDHMSKAAAARRVEVFTGAGRRREWSADQKSAILAESYAGVSSVCDVARRYGLTPTQLFTWRRADRLRKLAQGGSTDALFVPAVVDAPGRALKGAKDERQSGNDESPLIGVELAGASMWVCRGADVSTVTAIIKALKAAK